MGIKMTKDQGWTVSFSTLTSIVGSLGAMWVFAAPIAQNALAGEIEKYLQPMQAAQVITITATVKNLRNQISALEFKRDMCGGSDCWTVRDAQDLSAARDDLKAAEDALRSLKE